MNKSLEFITNRIKAGNVKNMTLKEFSNMQVIPFNNNNIINDNLNFTLTYDPNADFDYFTLETCYCDGTLIFVQELMNEIIKKIYYLKTCYSPTLEKFPNGIDFNKHKIHYTVGDFIFNSWITESPDPNRPWMTDKFTVMLPIKFEIDEI